MIILAVDPGTYESGYCVFNTDTYKIVDFFQCNASPLLSISSYSIRKYVIMENHTYTPIRGCRSFGKVSNSLMKNIITTGVFDRLVLEDIVNQGVNGKSIIQTVRWTGRFDEACKHTPFEYISRPFVKKHLTGRVNGIKDTHIRKKVIERLYPTYNNKDKGPLKGITADIWQALALAITYADLVK